MDDAESGRPRWEWTVRADEQGRFEWSSAPATEVAYRIEAPGYQSPYHVQLVPDGAEHAITLRREREEHRTFRISGTALDAESGELIQTFHVLTVTTEGEKTDSGFRPTAVSSPELQVIGTAGKFSFDARQSVMHYILEARATGYEPTRMELEGPVTNDLQVAFKLKRGTPLTGIVRLPDGRPAAEAVVMLSAEAAHQDSRFPNQMQTAYMKLPGEFDIIHSEATHTTTDAEGRFSFEPKLAMKRILVAHKSGYCEVSVDQLAVSHDLVLQPWGRVAGTLRIGDRLGTNETLNLRNWGWANLFAPSLRINLETKTDTQGRFIVEGVPPGEWQISHEVNLGSSPAEEFKPIKIRIGSATSMILLPRSASTQTTLVRAEPGQTAQINFGGTGRKVVGKVKPIGITQPIDWQRDVQRLTSKASRPQVGAVPKREDFTSDEEYASAQQPWYARAREFWLSESGAQAKQLAHDYALIFDTNGNFHIDDVLPGDYELQIRVSDPTIPDSFFRGKSIGTLTKEISVPAEADTATSEPMDLGVLELTPLLKEDSP